MHGTKWMLLVLGPALYGVMTMCGKSPFVIGIHKCISAALLIVVVMGIFSTKKTVNQRKM